VPNKGYVRTEKRVFSKHRAESCQRKFLFTTKQSIFIIFQKWNGRVFTRNEPKAVCFASLTGIFHTKKIARHTLLSFIQKNEKCDMLRRSGAWL
jgi:hypothetical protein